MNVQYNFPNFVDTVPIPHNLRQSSLWKTSLILGLYGIVNNCIKQTLFINGSVAMKEVQMYLQPVFFVTLMPHINIH